ncbi:MAG: hypothetical protein DWQ05_21815 [Calditrichaeota bacterium]|nr:MAG: hypothetical protein DWQ05_21815 [Calditrichota bacterium]
MKKQNWIFYLISLVTVSPIFAGQWETTSEPVKIVEHENQIYMNPGWSYDGRFLAFTKANYRGILIWDADTKKITELNDEIGAGFGMQWAPKQNHILARVAEYRGIRRYSAVKIFDVGQKSAQTIVTFQKSMPDIPRWMNNGNVYFADRKGVHTVRVENPQLKSAKVKASHDLYMIQGRSLVRQFSSAESVEPVSDFSGKRIINLSWSPDFSKIAFEVVGGSMFAMNSDGSNLVDLGVGDRPKWSPDSKALVFMISKDDGHHFTESEIYIISANGSDRSQITASADILEMNPSWGHDGQSLVYDVLGQGAIYSVKIGQK